ncbi:TolC family outer membrane protein [Pseudomonas chlororaphis]|uniref:TolC family outer membrane protein n=1 Tax=Pseudomonas chlororaphis TaxID=587753 RepID=UPI001E3EF498|nr:TolC family outer membrane protein [Pseudomonas chlororaphis]MCB2254581.1 TolC family outer membrane protein [Pseudomonas chlororaphis]
MFHLLSLRHDAFCLIVILLVSVTSAIGKVSAQTVYTIPNSRYAQAPVKSVEDKRVEQVSTTVVSKKGTKEERDVPPVSLASLIEAGQFPPPATRLEADDRSPVNTDHPDLATAIHQAIASYPDIKRAHEGVNEQLQQVEVARAGYFPKINGGVSSGYQSGVPGGGNAQAFDLSASQMLYDFGKVASTVEASRAGVAQRQAEVGLSIEQVTLNTALAFLDSQFYQRGILIARDQIESLEKVSALARQRFDMGASTRSDYIQTASRIEAAKVSELQYQANLARSLATLASLTGKATMTGVADSFPTELEQSCLRVGANMQDNPEVISAQARVDRARAEVKEAKAAGLPTISLEPTFTQQLDGDSGGNQDRSRYSVFLNASMPIYQGGAIQAAEAASERALASAQAGLDTVRLNARQELQQAKSQVLTLHSSLGAQSLRERAINETRVLYRQQYLELGTRPLLDLLNAEQEAYLSRIEQQSTLNTLRRLQINCLYSAGHLSRSFGAASDDHYRERLP